GVLELTRDEDEDGKSLNYETGDEAGRKIPESFRSPLGMGMGMENDSPTRMEKGMGMRLINRMGMSSFVGEIEWSSVSYCHYPLNSLPSCLIQRLYSLSFTLVSVRQEEYLHELRSALQTREALADNDALRALVARVLAHYQQYYEQKSRIANFDVSLVFSPPWFSPFERSFFWIAGFKPGLAFRIVNNSVDDMDGDQVTLSVSG
nr:protein DOG1-like 4 [Tanacetum cinerariifolium]